MQNFAFSLSAAPHEEHPFPPCGEIVCLGINAGSGVGKVPGSPNASCAETIPGGPLPTGFSAVPDLGGCPIPPAIIPGCPIPGINPGDCVFPEPEPTDFFNSKITLIARNSNADYATFLYMLFVSKNDS